jgi:hypothetical protein
MIEAMGRSLSCLTVGSIFIGFAIAILLIRTWHLRRKHPGQSWVPAKADALIMMSIVVSLLFVVVPILAIPAPSRLMLSVAQGGCATSAAMMAAYPFALLNRREAEGIVFLGACTVAALAAFVIFVYC